jgi:hypothetical protein
MSILQALRARSRWLKVIAAAVVVGLSFLYLGRQMARGFQQLDLATLQVRWPPLILSLGLFSVSTYIGGLCWSLILAGLGHPRPLRQSLKIHLSANIAKYLPGFAWQILGKAYLCRGQGIGPEAIAVGIFCEFAGVFVTGLWVACPLLPSTWLAAWNLRPLQAWRWPCWIALSGVMAAAPALLRWAVGRWPQRMRDLTIHARPLWLTLAWMIAAWCALGSAVFLCTTALYPLQYSAWPSLTCAWATTSLLSLVIIFVPTGIGIKEGALTFLLGLQIPGAIAAVVAILTRVLSVLGEVLWFLVAQTL